MNPEQEAFQQAIAADRYDGATRLVFADWLEERGLDDEALEQRRCATASWQESDRFLHEFVRQCNDFDATEDARTITYEDVIQAGFEYIASGDVFVQNGSDRARCLMYEDNMRELFWQHWSVVTRVSVSNEVKQQSPFTCSC